MTRHREWNRKVYWIWIKSLPFEQKWIHFVILFFPFFATTWDEKSLGISPLQILGFTVLIFSMLFTFRMNKRNTRIDYTLFVFNIILYLNIFALLFEHNDFSTFSLGLKIILPFSLYGYFSRSIGNYLSLEGFFITFLIASIFPILVLFYEILFDPIREVYNTESRGGGLRLSGFYSDLFGYMSHLIGGYVIYGYFFIKSLRGSKKHWVMSVNGFTFVTTIFLVGIYNLRHQASWAVSLILILILFSYAVAFIGIANRILLLLAVLAAMSYFYLEVFETLYAKDLNVFNGDASSTAALNGRVGIWERYFYYWEDFGLVAKLFGVGFELHFATKIMMSGGMHNDYVRLFFSTGILGFIIYISWLLKLLLLAMRVKTTELRFLFLSTMVILILYSVSSLPLLSAGILAYLLMAILAQIKFFA